MSSKAQEADRELRNRYSFAAKQLDPWKSAIDAMTDSTRRQEAIGQLAKIQRLAGYVADRLGDLGLARETGQDYLCRDAEKKVDEFEREVLRFRGSFGEDLGSVLAKAAPMARPSAIGEMRAALDVSSSLDPLNLRPPTARSSVVREMRARAMLERSRKWRHFSRLTEEFERWEGAMSDLSRKILHLERQSPENIAPVAWRRQVAELQSQRRRTVEKIGRCRGWIQTGENRMASTKDWQRDFELAHEFLEKLKKLVAEATIRDESQAPPPPVPIPVPEFKTVPIGPASKATHRRRPGMGMASRKTGNGGG